jgi:antagonist of KipI
LPYAAEPSAFYLQPFTVRYVKGQHFDLLPPESQARLHTQAWRISQASERMGYRLEAEALPMRAQVSLLSAGLSRGSIQLPPNGLPIVLMADHQTTGGYPVLGQVIEADWPKLAQMGPGQTLQFSPVDLWEALESLQAQERYVQRLAWAVKHNCIVAKKL